VLKKWHSCENGGLPFNISAREMSGTGIISAGDYNVFTIEWSHLADWTNYFAAAANTRYADSGHFVHTRTGAILTRGRVPFDTRTGIMLTHGGVLF
jgi:hypothetical protein